MLSDCCIPLIIDQVLEFHALVLAFYSHCAAPSSIGAASPDQDVPACMLISSGKCLCTCPFAESHKCIKRKRNRVDSANIVVRQLSPLPRGQSFVLICIIRQNGINYWIRFRMKAYAHHANASVIQKICLHALAARYHGMGAGVL